MAAHPDATLVELQGKRILTLTQNMLQLSRTNFYVVYKYYQWQEVLVKL